MKARSKSVLFVILDRVASLAILYSTLACVFIVLLSIVAFYTPAVVSFVLFGSADVSFLSAAEYSHLVDVHNVIRNGLLLAVVCVLVLLAYQRIRGISRLVVRDALIMCCGVALMLIPFSWTFERMHSLLFPQGNWQFSLDSWLITHYPMWFFIVFAVMWIFATAGVLWYWKKKII